MKKTETREEGQRRNGGKKDDDEGKEKIRKMGKTNTRKKRKQEM